MELAEKVFHKSRREKLNNILDDNSLLIILGASNVPRSYDDGYKFKQNKNFFYLTGFNEPNSALLLAPGGMDVHDEKSKKIIKTKELLFVQKKDPLRETWVGRRLGFSNVKKELGIESGMVNSKLGDVINDLISRDK